MESFSSLAKILVIISKYFGRLILFENQFQFVPDDLKDDKYWARRRKNNMAAKRSRDARRMKENQIALRAGFLEKEVRSILRKIYYFTNHFIHNTHIYIFQNMALRQELELVKKENLIYREKLSKFTTDV